jgi:hypothetical protein
MWLATGIREACPAVEATAGHAEDTPMSVITQHVAGESMLAHTCGGDKQAFGNGGVEVATLFDPGSRVCLYRIFDFDLAQFVLALEREFSARIF